MFLGFWLVTSSFMIGKAWHLGFFLGIVLETLSMRRMPAFVQREKGEKREKKKRIKSNILLRMEDYSRILMGGYQCGL